MGEGENGAEGRLDDGDAFEGGLYHEQFVMAD
jgi:hypothetical protein